MRNPYLPGEDVPHRKRSIHHEKRVARLGSPGTRARPGSGCRPFGRGDLVGRDDGTLGEHKFIYSGTSFFVLERRTVIKISREAIFGERKRPYLLLTFEGLEADGVEPDWRIEPAEKPPEDCVALTINKSGRIKRDFVSLAFRDGRRFLLTFRRMPPDVSTYWVGRPYEDWRREQGFKPRLLPPKTTNRTIRRRPKDA